MLIWTLWPSDDIYFYMISRNLFTSSVLNKIPKFVVSHYNFHKKLIFRRTVPFCLSLYVQLSRSALYSLYVQLSRSALYSLYVHLSRSALYSLYVQLYSLLYICLKFGGRVLLQILH